MIERSRWYICLFMSFCIWKSWLTTRFICTWCQLLDWSRRVESSRSSRVFNSSRLDSSQNSWLEYSSWIENFESILDFNLLTQLEYSSQEFWLESSLDESSTRLELKYSTRRNQSKHFFKFFLTRLNTFQVKYLTWIQVLDLMQSI